MPTIYNLHLETHRGYWEGGSDNYDNVVMSDTDKQRLIDRYNANLDRVYQKCAKPLLPGENSVRFSGNTGGGCASVSCTIRIKEAKQADAKATPEAEKEKPICAKCGSDDILKDAYACWDVDAQDWVLNSTLDELVCEECEECEGPCLVLWRKEGETDPNSNRPD